MEAGQEKRPNSRTLAAALQRRKWLVLAFVIVGVVAGVAVGSSVKRKYTSSTELLVGSPNATVQAVPGFAAATESLASSYSRAGLSAQVIVPTARKLSLSTRAVVSGLSVTPIPDSNIITIDATSTSGSGAQALAYTAAKELETYVRKSQQQGGLKTVLKSYAVAARALVSAQIRLRELNLHHVKPPAATYTSAETQFDVAQTKAEALSTEYSEALQQDSAAAGVSVLASPSTPSSNRSSTVQKTAIVGLLLGLVLAGLLGFLLEQRSPRSLPLADDPAD